MYSVTLQDESLKLSWIVCLLKPDHEFWKVQLCNQFSLPLQQVLRANFNMHRVNSVIRKGEKLHPFWRSVLKIWAKYNYTDTPTKDAIIPLNSACKTPAVSSLSFLKKCSLDKLFTIQQLKAAICHQQSKKVKVLQTAVNRVPNAWQNPSQKAKNTFTTKILEAPVTTNAILKNIRDRESFDLRPLWQLWEQDLEIQGLALFWKPMCKIAYQILQIKMRSFYIRYINRAYVTNTRLLMMKVVQDDKCSFCSLEPETRVHLFWECPKIRPIWTEVIKICKAQVAPYENYTRAKCVLLGFDTPILNLIMTIVKYVIHTSRHFGKTPNIYRVLRKIISVRLYEKHAYFRLTALRKENFYNYWGKLANYRFHQLDVATVSDSQ